MPLPVTLTFWEMLFAAQVGLRRHLEAVAGGRKARFPESRPGQLLSFHVYGACAEYCVAKALNRHWEPHVNHFEPGDIGKMEVRWSMRKDLKVRPRDTGYVVAVTGDLPTMTVVGWIAATDAHVDAWKQDPNGHGKPAYFVPHGELTAFGTRGRRQESGAEKSEAPPCNPRPAPPGSSSTKSSGTSSSTGRGVASGSRSAQPARNRVQSGLGQ